ncbi:MAG: antibiotic biosynthesis monooxygenase [Bryobacterales bacterium]|nr:antibiotic biosynthesis monooxygenase [Bryobacterales bacterium]
MSMVTVALYVELEAKPGKEPEVETFLRDALPMVQQEPATTAWFAIRMGPSTFGIFDAFPDEAGRQTHLSGRVAEALMARASELFAQPPKIQKIDALAAKLPSQAASRNPTRPARTGNSQEERIPMQVGSELRIKNTGEIVIDNPEVELAVEPRAADATLAYRFNRDANEHVLRLLEPVADHQHMRVHRRDD